jgi:putative endopeptidase
MRGAVLGLLVLGCAARDAAPDVQRALAAKPPAGLEVSWMDFSVDPCVDFYRFACGGWLASTPPVAQGVVSARLSELDRRTLSVLRAFVEAAAGGQSVPGLRERAAVGDLYASCMSPNVQSRGMVEVEAQLALLREATSAAGVADAMVRLEARGIPTVLELLSVPDPEGGPLAVAALRVQLLGVRQLEPNAAPNAEVREAVRSEVQRTFLRSGALPEQARASADRVMALEEALAAGEAGKARKGRRPEHHLLSFEQLRALAPSFPWAAWAQASAVPVTTRFDVSRLSTLAGLETQLRSASLETWRSALHYAVLRALRPALPRGDGARWQTCLEVVSEGLPDALGAAFVQHVLHPEDVAAVRLLLGDLEQAFDARLDALAWMDLPTRQSAHAKLRGLVNRVGGPEQWPTGPAPRLTRESLVANLLALSRWELEREVLQLGRPVDRGLWAESVLRPNAYYNPTRNEILVPAALLQRPVFSPQFAAPVNFGLLGTVLGHEIVHGFDRTGRWLDASGAAHSGWTEASVAAFDARASCLEAQANATPVLGTRTVNGAATLDENLADLGGLRLALLALQAELSLRPETSPGGLSAEQQLFLGWGQLWCTKATATAASALLELDVHSPHPVRVNAPLRNLAEFARAFGCKADAPMVAHPRCDVW